MTAPMTRRPSAQQAEAQAHRQAYKQRKVRAKLKSEVLRQKEATQMEALPMRFDTRPTRRGRCDACRIDARTILPLRFEKIRRLGRL